MYYDITEIGRRIQRLRRAKGLTQERLAEELNISVVHLAKIENGKRGCSLDILVDIAASFDTRQALCEMLAEYNSEQSALEGRIEEITTPMLNEFIEKIVVHEANKSGGRLNRKHKVDIYFNFVGQIDLSEPTKQEESTAKPIAKKKAKVS